MFHLFRDTDTPCMGLGLCALSHRKLPTRAWCPLIILFTLLTTSCMLLCVCTDQWERIVYDWAQLSNLTTLTVSDHSPCDYTTVGNLGQWGWYLAQHSTHTERTTPTVLGQNGQDGSCDGSERVSRISLVLPQRGSPFRLCLDVDDQTWANVSTLCAPARIDRCLMYDTDSVKQPFCCVQCLYSLDEVVDLDEDGQMIFEPIFTVIGFLIVSLIVLTACHVLALITLFKKIVPVVMVTGILFLVSGAFMAFCLAAHEFKINVMNTKQRRLPYMTWEMISSARVTAGWSVDVGWMGFAFSVLTGILWIRFSYHLASETPASTKVKPTLTVMHANNVPNANQAGQDTGNAIAVPKTVRWATLAHAIGKDTASTVLPNSRPNSGTDLLTNAAPTSIAVTAPTTNGSTVSPQHPMMVEEAV